MGRYFFFIIILLHFSQAIGAQDRKDLTKKNNDHPFVFTSDKGRKDLILKKNNYSLNDIFINDVCFYNKYHITRDRIIKGDI